MNQERLMAKGLMEELKKKNKQFDFEASGLVIAIRMKISPYEDDIKKLDLATALASLSRLSDIQKELIENSEKIAKLKEDWGFE